MGPWPGETEFGHDPPDVLQDARVVLRPRDGLSLTVVLHVGGELREQGDIEDVTQVSALEPVDERLDQAGVHGGDRSGNRFVDGDLVQWVVLPGGASPNSRASPTGTSLSPGIHLRGAMTPPPMPGSEGPGPWNAR